MSVLSTIYKSMSIYVHEHLCICIRKTICANTELQTCNDSSMIYCIKGILDIKIKTHKPTNFV